MEFSEVVKSRYSCKKFDGSAIDSHVLTEILEAGRVAPTAKNLQEAHIYVAQSADALAKIDSVTPCRYNAPVVLVIAFDKNNVYTYPGGKYQSGIEDATIVTTHLVLAAKNAGVDSCWVNCFEVDKLAEALGLPENEQIIALIDLGYPAEGAGPLPNHSNRKELSEIVTYL